jgi:hypothetical protein
VPDSAALNSTPQRGPWRGFFGSNLSKTRILNTYNSNDFALQTAWYASQTLQKPNVGLLGLGADSRSVQFWGRLANTDQTEEGTFSNVGSHSNLIRQWAELAHWFPSLSGPLGAGSFPNFPAGSGSQNCKFTGFVTKAGPTDSHSFMGSMPLSTVWQPWQYTKDFMHGTTPACSQ